MPTKTTKKMILESLLLLSVSARIAAQRSVVFTASSLLPSPTLAPPACVTVDFHGQYQGTSVYAIDESKCSDDTAGDAPQVWLQTLEDATVLPATLENADILLHVQPARILGALDVTPQAWLASMEDHISTLMLQMDEESPSSPHSNQQVVLTQPHAKTRPHLLHLDTTQKSAFYSIPGSLLPYVDAVFPSNTVLVAVPKAPLPLPRLAKDVPKWLHDSLRDLHYSPLVDAILQDIKPDIIETDVRHLTAEDGHADWKTRHSFTDDGRRAGAWIKALIEKEAGVKCHYQEHDEGFSPNVICPFIGTEHPEELVILGAHYDSRGTFGHVQAPGGDDDASGVSALLSLARIFKSFNIQFKHTVVLAFFSGEEQGLLGSKAYAKQLKEGKENVRLMLQADMIGYHAPGEPMQLALPDQHDTIEARWLVGNISMTYVPDLQVGTTPACCSDHQSFDQQGFVSTWVFERNGPIADPKYHNSEDLSNREGYDFEQIAAIARVMLATVLTVADFTLQ